MYDSNTPSVVRFKKPTITSLVTAFCLSVTTVTTFATVSAAQNPAPFPDPTITPPAMTLPVGMMSPTGMMPPPGGPTAPSLPHANNATDPWLLAPERELFWEVFHEGEYEDLPELKQALTGAYLETNNPQAALLLGMSHLWTLVESSRDDETDATITDELILAEKYLEIAARLNPADARIPSWLGAVKVSLAQLHSQPELFAEGQGLLQQSIERYPEFGFFAAAFPLAARPANSPEFWAGIDMMWVGQDICLDTVLNRANPDYAPYMDQATTLGPKRVCWNSEKVPHNLEGFLLAFGDMLLKAGEVDTAKVIYANARLADSYERWSFRGELEDRLDHAEEIARRLATPDPADDPQMSYDSDYGCVMCHQK